jgi:hypothetical protein
MDPILPWTGAAYARGPRGVFAPRVPVRDDRR